jgi:molybdate transport system substrate-binding protein
MHLDLLSGGAARGLVNAAQDGFAAATGYAVRATFSAVGAVQDKLLAGEPCDLVILTASMIDALARSNHVLGDSVAPLGRVATGVAVRSGAAVPDVSGGDGLRQTLRAATSVYVPDTVRSTAGIHVLKVLRQLGIEVEVAARLREFPNGATAMTELARSTDSSAVGITQVSEIIATPGVVLVASLPAGFELATMYSVAVCARAREPALARSFAQLLAGPQSGEARSHAGFAA